MAGMRCVRSELHTCFRLCKRKPKIDGGNGIAGRRNDARRQAGVSGSLRLRASQKYGNRSGERPKKLLAVHGIPLI